MYVLDIQYLLSVLLVDALSRPYILLRIRIQLLGRNKTTQRWIYGRAK